MCELFHGEVLPGLETLSVALIAEGRLDTLSKEFLDLIRNSFHLLEAKVSVERLPNYQYGMAQRKGWRKMYIVCQVRSRR